MPINNLNKNIVFIKIGDDKKINRKVKRKTKPKARQQKPLIISSGGSIPYAPPQIQNLHYNKKSDDYFKDSLAAREKHDAILNAALKRHNALLNNVNTKTEYSNPLSEQNVNNHNKETLIMIICMIFTIVINQILMMTIFHMYHLLHIILKTFQKMITMK